MPVAKTYKDLSIVDGPYKKDNGRMYVVVKTKKGIDKEVRWYSNSEFLRMYPEEEKSVDKNYQVALGFTNGYITIFKGDQSTYNEYFKKSVARWAKWWGWYIASTDEVPADLPFGIEPIQLKWEKVSKDGILKPETELKGVIDTLLYDESDSVYVGEIGERLELSLKVEKAIPVNSVYGKTTMHIMHDDCGNEFIWTTAAKSLTPGNEYLMRGTVKTHNKYKGVQQTVLTRCKIL